LRSDGYPWNRHRTHPARPFAAERPSRTHTSHPEEEATKPAASNFLQQQSRFDKFIDVFNNERPHEALDMKCPEVYQPSARPYTGLPDIDYPLQGKTIVVTRCGRICLGEKNLISARSLPDKPSASKSPRRHMVGQLYGL
jgi:putative transposase